MTKVTTLANMPTSGAQDVSVKILDQSDLGWQGSEKDAKTGVITSNYVFKGGDPSISTYVTVVTGTSPKDGVTRNSIRLSTIETVLDDVTDEYIVNAPIEVVVAWNLPGPVYDAAKLRDMIGTAYSLTFNTLTTKVPDTGVLESFGLGLLTELYG